MIYSNNQSLEGSFNQEKNQTSSVDEDMSSIPSLFLRRWDDSIETGRLLSRQASRCSSVVNDREKKAKKKDQDIIESDMKWKPRHATIRSVNKIWKNAMEKALRAAEKAEKKCLGSNLAQLNALVAHAEENNLHFMSMVTYNKWVRGERENLLTDDTIAVIDSFCKKYIGE